MKEKNCARCKECKPIEAFAVYKRGPYSYCRRCQCAMSQDYVRRNHEAVKARRRAISGVAKENKLARTRAWREKNPDKVSEGNRSYYQENKAAYVAINRKKNLARYGLTVEQYEAMYRAQNGVCAVCQEVNMSGRRLAVDHDHASGQVRGLLCSRCNLAIGYACENIEILRGIIAYLENPKPQGELCER